MQIEQEYQKKLCEKITVYVEEIGDKSRRNFAIFAKSIGINKQSIYNYMELKRKPRPDIIAKILYKLNLPHLIEEFVSSIHPESYKYKKNEDSFFNKEMATLDENANDYFNNPEYFDILYRCYNKTGESLAKLRSEQGSSIDYKIKTLLDQELIVQNGDQLKCPPGKEEYRFEGKTIQNHIRLSAEKFKFERSMTKSNMMIHVTEKVDRKTREKVHEFLDNAISVAYNILQKQTITEEQKQMLINAIDNDNIPTRIEEDRTTFISLVMDDYERDVPSSESNGSLQ